MRNNRQSERERELARAVAGDRVHGQLALIERSIMIVLYLTLCIILSYRLLCHVPILSDQVRLCD